MIFIKALRDLLSLLRPKARLKLVFILLLFIFTAFLEMLGISLIFAYVGSLTGSTGGLRTRLLFEVLGIDSDTASQDQLVIHGGLALVAFFIVKNFCVLLAENLDSKYIQSEVNRISNKLLKAYTAMPYKKLITLGISKLESLIVKFPNVFAASLNSVILAVANFVKILLIILLLLFIDKELAFISVVLLGSTSAFTYLFTKHEHRKLQSDGEEKNIQQKEIISDLLNGYIDITLMGTGKNIAGEFNSSIYQSARIASKQALLKKMPKVVNEVLFSIAIAAAATYFYKTQQDLTVALSSLFVFAFAGLKLNSFFSQLTTQLQELYFSFNSRTQSISEVKQIAPELFFDHSGKREDESKQVSTEGSSFEGGLVIKDLSFTYPNNKETSLKNINLEINKGDFIGICGESGGGKSTLLLLLMGLFEADSGQITSGDLNIHSNIEGWQNKIGYISQNIYISSSSIKENVAFGYPEEEIDEERVWECLKAAQVAGFVEKQGKGLDTKLQDFGRKMSGGQRQRLCIARALYKDPSILVLDEAISSLGSHAERRFKATINQFRGKKTIIFVSHRISAIQDADKIYILGDGQIVASGTHQELKVQGSKFL